jgi:hypothetical protein
MFRSLTTALAAFALSSSALASAAQAQDAPRTPADLAAALECRDAAAYRAIGEDLFLNDKPPAWLKAVERKDAPLGYYEFELAQPITALGTEVKRVGFLKEWVLIELPRDQALALVAHESLARAPIRSAEQYYRFIDAESGPMLSVFELNMDALAALFAPPGTVARAPAAALFAGCNYAPASQEMFLEAATQADAMLAKTANDLKTMLGGER